MDEKEGVSVEQVNVDGIAEELKAWERWVIWQKNWYCNTCVKIPRKASGGTASTTDAATWGRFDEVLASTARADGIGFVLTDSPFVGIDIDDCMDGGRLERKARAIVERFGSYAELSPSGRGLHIIGKGRAIFPDDGNSQWGRRQAGLMGFKSFEVYNESRYLTVTGHVLDGYGEVADVQDVLDAMTAKLWPAQQECRTTGEQQEQAAVVQEPGTKKERNQAPLDDDSFLVQKASSGRRGKWFRSLYEQGELAHYGGDHSRADMALLGWLAFWTNGNAQQMERLFSASALGQREKWRGRQDYRNRSIQAALSHWNGKGYTKG